MVSRASGLPPAAPVLPITPVLPRYRPVSSDERLGEHCAVVQSTPYDLRRRRARQPPRRSSEIGGIVLLLGFRASATVFSPAAIALHIACRCNSRSI